MGDGSLSQEEIDALLMGEEPPKRSHMNILHQDEIDQLLSAISSSEQEEDRYAYTDRRKVRIYDIKRPIILRSNEKRIAENFFVELAIEIQRMLSEYIGRKVPVYVESVIDLTEEETFRSLDKSALIAEINMEPLTSTTYFCYSSSLVNMIIDGLLNYPYKSKITQYSDVDVNIIEVVSIYMIGCLREIYSPLMDIRPRLRTIHDNLQYTGAKNHILVTFNVDDCQFDLIYEVKDFLGLIHMIMNPKVTNPVDKDLLTGKINGTIQLKEEIFMSYGDLMRLKKGNIIPFKKKRFGLYV